MSRGIPTRWLVMFAIAFLACLGIVHWETWQTLVLSGRGDALQDQMLDQKIEKLDQKIVESQRLISQLAKSNLKADQKIAEAHHLISQLAESQLKAGKSNLEAHAARRTIQPFILFSTQRSGTHWVRSELSKHECIECGPELFLMQSVDAGDPVWNSSRRQKAVELLFEEHLQIERFRNWSTHSFQKEVQGLYENPHIARGFDWKLDQGLEEDWWLWLLDLIQKRGVKIVWLKRLNLMRQYISNKKLNAGIQKAHGVAAATSSVSAHAEGAMKVTLTLDKMLYEMDQLRRFNEVMDRRLEAAALAGVQTATIYYEHIVGSRTMLDHLRDFILSNTSCPHPGNSVDKTSATFHKINAGKLEDIIENWYEIANALKENPFYGYMLDLPEKPFQI